LINHPKFESKNIKIWQW